MANDNKKDQGHAPENIPQGDAKGDGIKGVQDLSSTATPNADQKGKPAQAVNPDAPKGKQWYRIKGPGGIKLNGVFYQEGATLQIAGADAQSIDGHLELLPGAPEAP